MARPVMELLELLGRRWALRVIWELRQDEGLTFRALQAACGDLSSSVLTERVRELSEAGVVGRGDAGYVLTSHGLELLDLLLPARRVGEELGSTTATGDAQPQAVARCRATMPPERLRHSGRCQPASAIRSARPCWSGQARIDSAR